MRYLNDLHSQFGMKVSACFSLNNFVYVIPSCFPCLGLSNATVVGICP